MVQAVVDCGALDSLVTCLEEFDPGVKEAASWTLGYVASHSPELAQQVRFLTLLAKCPAALHLYAAVARHQAIASWRQIILLKRLT